MSKHTAGPWELDTETRPAEICTIHGLPPQGEEGQTWVHIRGAIGYWDADENEQLANARLIAAAPNLLDACSGLLMALEDDCRDTDKWAELMQAAVDAISDATGDPWYGRGKRGRAAIAKATGAA